jgi:hypothetical protein
MNTATTVMTYAAEAATILSALVALAAWRSSLRRPHGRHRKKHAGH